MTIALLGLDATGPGAAHQVQRAQQMLRGEPGVLWAHVSPETEMAYVRYDPTRASVALMLDAIERCGLRGGQPSCR